MIELNMRSTVSQNVSEFQARLNALPGSITNDLSSPSWSFILPNEKIIIISFESIKLIQEQYLAWYEMIDLDLITITKMLWLDSVRSMNFASYRRKLVGIELFWMALASHNAVQLNTANLAEIINFTLIHQWDKNRLIRRNAPLGCRVFTTMFSIDSWRKTFHSLHLTCVAAGITKLGVIQTLKKNIPQLTAGELTYSDWTKGNSFNYLTLDYGQYYIEHCMDFFHRNIALATAISTVFRATSEISRTSKINEHTVKRWVTAFLDGASVNEIFYQHQRSGKNTHRLSSIQKIHEAVSDIFEENFRSAKFMSHIFEDTSLEEIISTLGIAVTQTQVDRFRIIVWHWLNNCQDRDFDYLLSTSQPPVCKDSLLSIIDSVRAKFYGRDFQLPTSDIYEEMGLPKSTNKYDVYHRNPRLLVRLVEYAGLTYMLSLTGWRKSELGFPTKAIRFEKNTDLLDQYALPYRYFINWHVYKTNGQVLERREVTFSIASLATKMQKLTGAHDDQPCLYRYMSNKQDSFNSGDSVSRAVFGLWSHYVANYREFKLLDGLKAQLKENHIDHFSSPDLRDTDRDDLLEDLQSISEVNGSSVDINLFRAWIRSRREWPILEFYFTYQLNADKKDWLRRYRRGTLKPEWTALLDANLSREARSWIESLSDHECESNNIVTRTVMYELLADCLYPTPHAIRHIWVEAVYRRFDGDAGWMIRSHFKHISKTMWLAYIRDKDNQASHQMTKERVVSSLLQNYLEKEGVGYAGHMHIFLRRLATRTTVMDAEEQASFANRIATVEIVDIKANPWGYCLLKQRTIRKARCSDMGTPQQHNASPELCLGCIHSLMQSENVEWVLFHLQSHVDVLRNPNVPNIFRMSSLELLRNAIKHVRLLDPHHQSLTELDEILNVYKESRIIL